MRLRARLVPVGQVSATHRDAMFALMDKHYANMQRRVFEADLAEKRWVIQVFDPADGALCGFSTQMLQSVQVAGRMVTALFSGDTVMDRDHWGDQALARAWGRLALSLMDSRPGGELYWFLMSKGYKTYRFLPVFFHAFYPRHDAPTPPSIQAMLDGFGRARYSETYDPAVGVIHAGPDSCRLRNGVADVSAERLRDAHVRFFVERNPGHVHGEELCCLAPLTPANLTRAAYRVIGAEPARAVVP